MRSRSILRRGVATLVAAAVALALAACSGGDQSAAPKAKPTSAPKPKPASTSAQKTRPESKPNPPAAPKAKPAKRKPKPPATHHRARSKRHAVPHGIPWHSDGVSLVARTRGRWLAIYGRPGAKRPLLVLRNPDGNGTPRVVLVRSQRPGWVRVYLPTRPNEHTGWIRERAVRLLKNPYRLVVDVRRHRLELWKERRLVLHATTVVGASTTPTPLGMYYVVELLRPPDPHGSYGPYSFGISAHSNVLKRFAGGDGRVGIHGTDAPWLLGSSVSHGCVRVRNDTIRRLARVLPLGTPVLIRS